MKNESIWNLGTVGFGYKDWDGSFYPSKTPARDYLKYYSQIYNSVEIDTSFYGCPRIEQIQRWSKNVTADFKFCFKTPRLITHDRHLLSSNHEMDEFLKALSTIEDKLGPVLIQLPPSFSTNEYKNLVTFLAGLPESGFKFAVELRNSSWFQLKHKTIELLSKYNTCWVSADYLDLPKEINQTSDFLYLRWIGKHNRYPVKDHERIDVSPSLKMWLEKIKNHTGQVNSIYGYFNNDYSGHSPATCNKFKKLIGLETQTLAKSEQVSLF